VLLRRLLLISGFAVTVAVLAPAAVTVAVLAPATAEAAEITASGWWTTTPVAVAPDAQGGLVVQGGPQADQPVSYAAVQFTLENGETASALSLTTAPSSGSTPGTTLTVCPLTDSFAPADGGAMADAPRYDCSSKASSAAINGVYAWPSPSSRALPATASC
jgi:hypothetical protein